MAQPRKELTLTRVVKASRERAFQAWTDPEMVVRWFGPNGVSNVECEIEPRVGGVFRLVMVAGAELGESAGERWPVRGEFLEFDPPARLVMLTDAVDDLTGTVNLTETTTVDFTDLGDGTTQVTVRAIAVGLTEQAPRMLEGMTQGWNETLDRFAADLV